MTEHDPSAMRKVYFDAWQKEKYQIPLSPLETIIVDVIHRHPEYQTLFAEQDIFHEISQEKFALDGNPFFHLALHVTIGEQVNSDRPKGIASLYKQIFRKYLDKTKTEHKMMDCLAKVLLLGFESDSNKMERHYMEMLKKLL